MVKVLILGAHGQLGRQFLKEKIQFPELNVIGLAKAELDLCDFKLVQLKLKEINPDVVINCSGYTAVDLAEVETEKARQINAEIPGHLASVCENMNIRLIHFSTDYVFDGKLNRAYTEMDSTHPLNLYGKTKLEGEKRVMENCSQSLVSRVAWLFSAQGKNFFLSMLRLGREKQELNIVDDQISSPTYAGFLAKDVFSLISNLAEGNDMPLGLFHYSCSGTCSWREFAQAILTLDGSDCKVNAISSEDFGAAAARPSFSKLDNTNWIRMSALPSRYWHDGLDECYSDYTETHGN